MQDNTVTVSGNLTRDPELRYTQSGSAVANFTVAVNKRTKNGDEWENQAMFFDVTAWNKLGEHAAESFSRGQRVMVDGRLEQRSWEDKTTGDKRSKVEIVADDIALSVKWEPIGGGGSTPAASNYDAPPQYDPDSEPF